MTSALVLFLSFLIFLLVGVPVAFGLAGASILSLLVIDPGTLTPIFSKMFSGANSWLLLAIPFFILAGNIMEKGGVTRRLVDFADAMVGFLPGGLSATNVVASMFFGGVSGSAVADTSATGTILVPAMVRQGYSSKYSAAITAASSPIGIIIPPSIPMILWGFTAGLSVADLFLAGVGAGILVGVALLVTSTVISVKRGYKSSIPFSFKNVFVKGKDGILALVTPVIIIVGIITGFATPTEAAVLAMLYSMFLGFFIYKELKIKHLKEIILNSGKMTATVMLIIISAAAFSYLLTINDVPSNLASFVIDMNLSPFLLMLMFIILFLFLGMFLDANAAIIMTVPVIAPVIVTTGLDPIHASVILIATLGIGLLTPPVGLCTYVAAGIANLRFDDLMRDLVPFVLVLLLCIILMVIFPQIITLIPNLVNS
ncbi:ABC transporter permease [Lentibacillus populi]|uniref:ABC transporter permease n=1 Tax=Lentibacillus populi TaxID=1827502 RepID=A0A9W5X5Z5_9BACI|nr:TRAP transporter large permease [Lentibacillus populi]GGB48163.1 ABC transporter permease [Lentibacillus populi]